MVKLVEAPPLAPELWRYLSANCPPGLIAYKNDDGYGSAYGVTIKAPGMPGVLNKWFGPSVAVVEGLTVTLNYPEWCSDFQDLLTAYENRYERETTLVVRRPPVGKSDV
jgi:hypothetical protein